MKYNEAVAIYVKHVAAMSGGQAMQPNASLSKLINGVWYLRNIQGPLARVGTKKKQVF